jgi:hypothetical protein
MTQKILIIWKHLLAQSFLWGACGILSLRTHRAIKENKNIYGETQILDTHMHVYTHPLWQSKQKHKHSYTCMYTHLYDKEARINSTKYKYMRHVDDS